MAAGHAFVQKYDNSGNVQWTRQFGSSAGDEALGITSDLTGVYAAGQAGTALPGQTSAGMADAYVRKDGRSRNLLWNRQFGTTGDDRANAIVADSNNGVYASGVTDGALPGQTSGGYRDAFVRKYDSSGTLQWTRQFGTAFADEAFGITIDPTGVYAAGSTGGTLTGQKSAGYRDAFVRKFG